MTFDDLWKSFPTLETERLILRQTTLADAEPMYGVFADPEVTRYYDLLPFTSIDQAVDLVKRQAEGYAQKRYLRWAIVRKEDDVYLGSCGFHHRHDGRIIQVGYELGRPYWRNGYMSEALAEIIRFVFEELGAHRIEALIFPENVASIATAAKVGMKKEGILRERFYFNGRYIDELYMSILRSEYEAAQ